MLQVQKLSNGSTSSKGGALEIQYILRQRGDISSAIHQQAQGRFDTIAKDRHMVASASSYGKGTDPRALRVNVTHEQSIGGARGFEQSSPTTAVSGSTTQGEFDFRNPNCAIYKNGEMAEIPDSGQ